MPSNPSTEDFKDQERNRSLSLHEGGLTMRRWFMRNFVCRFKGHLEGVRMPLFKSWQKGIEIGSIHCKRCGAMIGEYRDGPR